MASAVFAIYMYKYLSLNSDPDFRHLMLFVLSRSRSVVYRGGHVANVVLVIFFLTVMFS